MRRYDARRAIRSITMRTVAHAISLMIVTKPQPGSPEQRPVTCRSVVGPTVNARVETMYAAPTSGLCLGPIAVVTPFVIQPPPNGREQMGNLDDICLLHDRCWPTSRETSWRAATPTPAASAFCGATAPRIKAQPGKSMSPHDSFPQSG